MFEWEFFENAKKTEEKVCPHCESESCLKLGTVRGLDYGSKEEQGLAEIETFQCNDCLEYFWMSRIIQTKEDSDGTNDCGTAGGEREAPKGRNCTA